MVQSTFSSLPALPGSMTSLEIHEGAHSSLPQTHRRLLTPLCLSSTLPAPGALAVPFPPATLRISVPSCILSCPAVTRPAVGLAVRLTDCSMDHTFLFAIVYHHCLLTRSFPPERDPMVPEGRNHFLSHLCAVNNLRSLRSEAGHAKIRLKFRSWFFIPVM